jgi:hypothetical protein
MRKNVFSGFLVEGGEALPVHEELDGRAREEVFYGRKKAPRRRRVFEKRV